MTGEEIITAAAKVSGQLGAGRELSNSEKTDALVSLNLLRDQWGARNLFIFTVQASRYPLTPPQPSYTIGPSGADFTAPRPMLLTAANIVMTTIAPEVRVPLRVLDDDEWAATRVQQLPVTLPTRIYNDGGAPNSRLYLWGYPTIGNDLELFTGQPADQFALDVVAVTPPGYESGLVYTLAELLCAQLWRVPPPPMVTAHARLCRAGIQSRNSAAPKLAADSFNRSHSTFNYRTGL